MKILFARSIQLKQTVFIFGCALDDNTYANYSFQIYHTQPHDVEMDICHMALIVSSVI